MVRGKNLLIWILKEHDLFKTIIVKVHSEHIIIRNFILHSFSEEKIDKVKQLYNSQNDVVYALKKMRKVECQMKDYSTKLKPLPRK